MTALPGSTITVTGKRESDMGKVVDMAAGLTHFGYPLDLYGAIYGETFFGREQLGTWERLLGIVPFAGPIRRVGGAALDVAKRVDKFGQTPKSLMDEMVLDAAKQVKASRLLIILVILSSREWKNGATQKNLRQGSVPRSIMYEIQRPES